MKRLLCGVVASVLLQPTLRTQEVALPSAKLPPKIVLKLDDLTTGKSPMVSAKWQRLADFIKERRAKINIGIICDSLEDDKPEYFRWIKDLQSTGLVTFWLHAYNHKPWTAPDGSQYNEFNNRSYEEQRQRLEHCQQLAKEKLGFYFDTFGPPGTGAPGPGTDANTYRAVQDDPHLKVWLYGSPADEASRSLEAQGKVTVLDRVWQVNIEHPIFEPSLAEFQKGYAQFAAQRDYFVLQGHPQHWNDEGFAEFVKLVEYAVAQGCTFVTPKECAESLPVPKSTTPPSTSQDHS